MNTIRIMLVEQVRILRELFQNLLNEQPDMHVVAKVHESTTAQVRVRELDPDVVLIGTLNGDAERLDLVRQLRAAAPRTRVVLMDFRPTDRAVSQLLQAGVDGFVLQDTPTENMLHMLRLSGTVPGDGVVPEVAPVLPVAPARSDPVAAFAGAFMLRPLDAPARLTRREEEIASYICEGRSNKEIAGALNVSLHTVKTHVRRILEKLSLHSRVQIAAYGYRGVAPYPHSPVIPQE